MKGYKYSKNEVVDLIANQLKYGIAERISSYKNIDDILEDLEVEHADKDVFRKFEKRFANVINFLRSLVKYLLC